MIVISDTSPLMNLGMVGKLELLHDLFEIIMVPETVMEELVFIQARHSELTVDYRAIHWIKVQTVSNKALVRSLSIDLDPGEAEAIALATENKTRLLIVDERRARAIAGRLGLCVMGLLGILLLAKARGLLSEIKPVLESLVSDAGFWVSQTLYDEVLKAASEKRD